MFIAKPWEHVHPVPLRLLCLEERCRFSRWGYKEQMNKPIFCNIGMRSVIHFSKIGIKPSILFRKIGMRIGWHFEAGMARPYPKSGQVQSLGHPFPHSKGITLTTCSGRFSVKVGLRPSLSTQLKLNQKLNTTTTINPSSKRG